MLFRSYVHLYYNAVQAGTEFDRFTSRLLRVKKDLESGKLSESDRKRYSRYFIVKETPRQGRSALFNEDEI